MPQIELTESEHDLMGRLCQFCVAHMKPGETVYQGTMFSASLSAPVYLVVAIGDDALAMQAILQREAQARPKGMIEIHSTLQ